MAELDGLRSQLESSRSAGTDSQVSKRVERVRKREERMIREGRMEGGREGGRERKRKIGVRKGEEGGYARRRKNRGGREMEKQNGRKEGKILNIKLHVVILYLMT